MSASDRHRSTRKVDIRVNGFNSDELVTRSKLTMNLDCHDDILAADKSGENLSPESHHLASVNSEDQIFFVTLPLDVAIDQVISLDFLDQMIDFLLERTDLSRLIIQHLYLHLLKVYKFKVEEVIKEKGKSALDTFLPHIQINTDISRESQVLQFNIDEITVKKYLNESLSDFFCHESFKGTISNTFCRELLNLALQELESELGSKALREMSASQLQQIIIKFLKTNKTGPICDQIKVRASFHSREIALILIEQLSLPSCSLEDMHALLGLRRSPLPKNKARIELPAVTALPTSIPIASSIKAQLRPDLWQQDENSNAKFKYRSKSNPGNFIEHYITSPGDIALLPWEAAEQIIDIFGFDTVKLQLIFAAKTMEQEEPWNSSFTLNATDIIKLLGWDKNHNTALPEKRLAVASTAYALSCLLVRSVWIAGRGKSKIDASTPTGRMWDVLIEPTGQFDFVTKKIEKPEEVYITVSPGLWTMNFLNRAGLKAQEALYQFGYLAKDILQIDPYHNEMALRLAIQLTLDSRIRARNENPYDYTVGKLLEEVIPLSEIETARNQKGKARDLRKRWDKSLKMLNKLGWLLQFDPETYPSWLQPDSESPKPKNWRKVKLIDRLLDAKLTISPPNPIPELLTKIGSPKKMALVVDRAQAVDIEPSSLLKARKVKGLSRKQLAGFIDVSSDYIGKMERGDRPITLEIAEKLKRILVF
ncbi:helix-turn-helix domain-containing protein [Acaryochloris marina]|uniref:helix-turn-helix domain-containing protein n=1 Tax=Acaryochloris marina TaxID=155978 RepID=UPI0021C49787|nr:helix-turn-helix transcriptional regulator [Acaryochloris marina]BDM83461.1 hypothetical protein AM10699_63220 [Acaryochloris marina MBIC10699]